MQTKREALQEAIEQVTEKVADVVDMPRAEPHTIQLTIQLTKTELLEFENLGLKEALAKSQIKDALMAINEKRNALADSVTERIGADVRRYTIDPKTGTGHLPEKE